MPFRRLRMAWARNSSFSFLTYFQLLARKLFVWLSLQSFPSISLDFHHSSVPAYNDELPMMKTRPYSLGIKSFALINLCSVYTKTKLILLTLCEPTKSLSVGVELLFKITGYLHEFKSFKTTMRRVYSFRFYIKKIFLRKFTTVTECCLEGVWKTHKFGMQKLI